MREIEGEGQREGVIERGRQGRHRERESGREEERG